MASLPSPYGSAARRPSVNADGILYHSRRSHDGVETTDGSINPANPHCRRALDSSAGDVEERQILLSSFAFSSLRLCASAGDPAFLEPHPWAWLRSENPRVLARRGAEALRKTAETRAFRSAQPSRARWGRCGERPYRTNGRDGVPAVPIWIRCASPIRERGRDPQSRQTIPRRSRVHRWVNKPGQPTLPPSP